MPASRGCGTHAPTGRLKLEDFRFLAIADAGTSMFFVGKGSGFKTFREALDLAKKSPNKTRVATAGLGTQDDVAVRVLTAAGYPMVNVPMDPGAWHAAPIVGARRAAVPADRRRGVVRRIGRPDAHRRVRAQAPSELSARAGGLRVRLQSESSQLAQLHGAGRHPRRARAGAHRRPEESAVEQYRDICSKQHKCLPGLVLGDDARKYAAQYHEDMSKLMKELGLAK